MKIFIWKNIDRCSDNYHPDGGVVVIAENLEAAMALAGKDPYCQIREEETPDFVCDIMATDPRVFIFPNAGCC